MLKPMKPQTGMPRNLFLWILVGLLVISGVVALVSALGGGESGEDEVNAVYTNAAATLAAQMEATLQSTPTATGAGTPTPTATFLPLPSPTLFTAPILPTNTAGAVSGAVGCNNSVWVADVTFPDNTVVTPGQAIAKTWRLQNTGSCPWTPTFKVTFLSGNAMGGVTTPIGITVAPGATGDITVNMTAPTTAGEAKGTWILTNDSGQNFGTWFTIVVKVGAAGTGTATATAGGASSTPTMTPSLTPETPTISIDTLTPSNTPEPTATPTP
ncbi:MAG: hypothetical protein KPEEDBHJ_01883 [Anaerolineales bacterium]|nr:hypothetical protein [Anaerolineales bacterium]